MPRKFMRRSYGTRRRYRRRGRRTTFRRMRRIAFSIAEKKYYDFWFGANDLAVHLSTEAFPPALTGDSASLVPVTSGSIGSLINTIAQGVAFNQRIGNKIFVEYIQLSVQFQFTAPGGQSLINGCQCRYSVMLDRRAGGTSGSNLWSPTITNYPAFAFKDATTMARYKTLLDKQCRMSFSSYPDGSTSTARATGTGVPLIQHYIPIKREFQYSGTTTDSMRLSMNMKNTDLIFAISSQHENMCWARIGVRVCYRDA